MIKTIRTCVVGTPAHKAPEGAPVRLLWVFDLFEAESADHVRRIYEVSGVPVERVTEGRP